MRKAKKATRPPSTSPPYPTTTVASLAALAQSVNVATELQDAKELYSGDKWLSVCNMPAYLQTNLDRIRRQVTPRPGLSPTIACCLEHGLRSLTSRDEIQRLQALKSRIDCFEWDDNQLAHEIHGWYKVFLVGVDVGSMTSGGRQNVAMPESTKVRLEETAGDLGLSASRLAILAVTSTLSFQPEVVPGDCEILSNTVTSFLRRCAVRCDMGEAMLRGVERTRGW